MARVVCMTLTFSALCTGVIMAQPVPLDTSVQGNLTRARSWWNNRALDSYYAYGYQKSCRCLEDIRGPNWVVVRDGNVTSVTRRDAERTPISSEYYNDTAKTIPDLFDVIQDAIDTQADEILVTYDQEYGYPVDVSIDYDVGVADEEYVMTLDYFAPYEEWNQQREANFNLWQSTRSSSYEFTMQRFCECMEDYTGPFRVTVQDNNVTNVTRLLSMNDINNASVATSRTSTVLSPEELNIPTIDKLFDIIQKANLPFALRVTYDDMFGFPSDVNIDYDEFVSDEEFIISVRDVVFMPEHQHSSAASNPFLRVGRDLLVGGLALMVSSYYYY